jgi:hypothetical protein
MRRSASLVILQEEMAKIVLKRLCLFIYINIPILITSLNIQTTVTRLAQIGSIFKNSYHNLINREFYVDKRPL